ncbi:MAG: IS607 family transposase [Anaerolineae bacterium]|nr:IS607 family transposase [Anaerolineae bacterium]MCQ3972201.1 IS607 family transposase [Anaerolineae bacterium]
MIRTYRPHEFAKLISRTTQTLQRWDRVGILKAHRTPTNRRYYTHDQYLQVTGQKVVERQIVVYYRVSSTAQKADLASQKAALEQFCIAAGKPVGLWLQDVGSGLNYQRKNFVILMEMVERGEVSEIVIAHQDRLVRFGYEWFEKFCQDHGTSVTVINAEGLSPEAEMTQDLLSIIHCFSSRVDGLRRYKKKITELIQSHADDQTN